LSSCLGLLPIDSTMLFDLNYQIVINYAAIQPACTVHGTKLHDTNYPNHPSIGQYIDPNTYSSMVASLNDALKSDVADRRLAIFNIAVIIVAIIIAIVIIALDPNLAGFAFLAVILSCVAAITGSWYRRQWANQRIRTMINQISVCNARLASNPPRPPNMCSFLLEEFHIINNIQRRHYEYIKYSLRLIFHVPVMVQQPMVYTMPPPGPSIPYYNNSNYNQPPQPYQNVPQQYMYNQAYQPYNQPQGQPQGQPQVQGQPQGQGQGQAYNQQYQSYEGMQGQSYPPSYESSQPLQSTAAPANVSAITPLQKEI